VEAEDGEAVAADQATETAVDGPVAAGGSDAARPEPHEPAAGSAAESGSTLAAVPVSEPEPEPTSEAGPESEVGSDTDADADSEAASSRRGLPIATGIGCAALLLPLVAVAGAILCFAAGILSAATGCAPNGSALCSANGPWFAFALPLFVSPLIAAGTAIGAVTVRRHRSTWLAVGYGIVFISVIVGLASASTGSN
jgi:hypothetical protein